MRRRFKRLDLSLRLRRINIRFTALLFLLIFAYAPAFAATEATLTLDALAFRASGEKIYLELHIDLPRGALEHRKEADGWFASANFKVWLKRDTLTLAMDEWTVVDLADDSISHRLGRRIVDARIYEMSAGTYDIFATVTDSMSQATINAYKRITLTPFPENGVSISDIQLAAYVIAGDVHPRFDRGGFSIIPNPRRIFTPPQPISIYYELYPPPGTVEDIEIIVKGAVTGAAGETIRELPAQRKKGHDAMAVIDTLSVAGLPGGTYFLELEAEIGKSSFVRRAKFMLFRLDSLNLVLPPLKVDSAAVELELKEVEFLLTRDQIDVTGKMSPTEKARFLDQFWRRYDNDYSTPDVPLRRLFHERVEEADRRWTNSRSAGHHSDRGRIYVIHGEPDDRDIHTLDLHAKPYEIWSYSNLQGGVIFAFVDRSALGEFTLVHSTLRGEVSNPNWYEEYVIKSGIESGR